MPMPLPSPSQSLPGSRGLCWTVDGRFRYQRFSHSERLSSYIVSGLFIATSFSVSGPWTTDLDRGPEVQQPRFMHLGMLRQGMQDQARGCPSGMDATIFERWKAAGSGV